MSAAFPEIEVLQGRATDVGGIPVLRHLPTRQLRTVGAWCFADEMGPVILTSTAGLGVGPHPHTGLQTVTWLLEGEVVHRDSLGSEELIRPGQVNLMTAGRGVVHAEESTGRQSHLHGIQLWIAQPESSRHGDADFAHHAELPGVEFRGAFGTVFAGRFAGVSAPTHHDTSLVGVDLQLTTEAVVLPLTAGDEHCLLLVEGAVEVDGQTVDAGRVVSLGSGRDEVTLRATETARVLLLGGEPVHEQLFMWWNFVGRSRDEIDAMYKAWRDGLDQFGEVDTELERIPAPRPPWEPMRVSTSGSAE